VQDQEEKEGREKKERKRGDRKVQDLVKYSKTS
jgi:hypothetical protein